MDYSPIIWVDHIVDQQGQVVQQGTPMSAEQFNRIEEGVEFSHNQEGNVILQAMQEIGNIKKDMLTLFNQRILQGQSTISWSPAGDLVSAYPYVLISLPVDTYSQLNAPDYDVVLSVVSADDPGKVGLLSAFDKTQNGFKVQFTGSAETVTFNWLLVNMKVK